MSAGRPSKCTPLALEMVLDKLRGGCTLRVAALSAGMDEDTLIKWRRSDDDVAAKVNQAMGEACAFHAERIQEASRKDWRASAYFLNRHDPIRPEPPPACDPPAGDADEAPRPVEVGVKGLVLRAMECGIDVPTAARLAGISQAEIANIRADESRRRRLESAGEES